MIPAVQEHALHTPVMVAEVLNFLAIQPAGVYLDGTIGTGGHAREILSQLGPQGRLIGLDRDPEALEICRQTLPTSPSPHSLFQLSFERFETSLGNLGIEQVNGILLDLGLSSRQLDSTQRGFAYQSSGDLDMRYNPTRGSTAAELIRSRDEAALATIISEYGEDRWARRIARSLKRTQSIQTVPELVEAIRRCTPPRNRHRTYARVFQALRIAVNQELKRLEEFLDRFAHRLVAGGRIVILSYHSLEDRRVKQAFLAGYREDLLNILTAKPLRPGAPEQRRNPRSRSAKLRAAEKLQ